MPIHTPGFVVHKTRGIMTLSSMHSQSQQQQLQQHQEPLVLARLRQAKEKNNLESKADERGLLNSPFLFFFTREISTRNINTHNLLVLHSSEMLFP